MFRFLVGKGMYKAKKCLPVLEFTLAGWVLGL
jgi:hypothetical protein